MGIESGLKKLGSDVIYMNMRIEIGMKSNLQKLNAM